MITTCWNCHKQLDSTELEIANYKGYDMFVCPECKKFLEERSELQSKSNRTRS